MDLKQELRKLVELQKIDSEIYSLKQKKDKENPERIKELSGRFQEKKQLLDSFEERLTQSQLKKKEKELDLQAKEDNVAKAKTQLYGLKTNKEYHAKLKEIESLKADVSVLEEAVLKTMEDIDLASKELADQQSLFREEENEFNQQKQEIEKQNQDLAAEIKQLEDKKKITTDTIDREVLPVYDRLVASRNGVAIAPVEGEICGACHMHVTAQTINQIKMYDKLVSCESCVRILYLKEDIE